VCYLGFFGSGQEMSKVTVSYKLAFEFYERFDVLPFITWKIFYAVQNDTSKLLMVLNIRALLLSLIY
jgi:hypothetical protein